MGRGVPGEWLSLAHLRGVGSVGCTETGTEPGMERCWAAGGAMETMGEQGTSIQVRWAAVTGGSGVLAKPREGCGAHRCPSVPPVWSWEQGVGVLWAPLSPPNWIPIPALCFHWSKSHLKGERRKVFSNHVFPAAGRATPRAGMSYCGEDTRFCYFFSLYKQQKVSSGVFPVCLLRASCI